MTELPAELTAYLQEPRIVVLTTLDHEHGGPTNTVISWVLARDGQTIRMAGDGRARFIVNLKANPRVVLTVLGAGSAWSIYGQGRVIADPAPDVPLRLAVAEVTELQVWNAMFWGARLTQEPDWEVTYDPAKAREIDEKVYHALRTIQAT